MTFEGYWVVLVGNGNQTPLLESLSRSASEARKKFLAHMRSTGQGLWSWQHWAERGYQVWPVNAGSVQPSDLD